MALLTYLLFPINTNKKAWHTTSQVLSPKEEQEEEKNTKDLVLESNKGDLTSKNT